MTKWKPGSLRWADLEGTDEEEEYKYQPQENNVERASRPENTPGARQLKSPLRHEDGGSDGETHFLRVQQFIGLGYNALCAEKGMSMMSFIDDRRYADTTIFITYQPCYPGARQLRGKSEVSATIASLGFCEMYNFIYAPFDNRANRTSGFCFINFKNHSAAVAALASVRRCSIVARWCSQFQGLSACLRECRRSARDDTEHTPYVLRHGVWTPLF